MLYDTNYPNQETKDQQYSFNFKPAEPVTLTIDDFGDLTEYEFTINLGPDYKFNEGVLLEQFEEYVKGTYNTHYSEEKFQATEFIIDGGHGTGFCMGNILKYAQRYGKKGTHKDARKDLLKVMHYALIQLHVHDLLHAEDEDPNSST